MMVVWGILMVVLIFLLIPVRFLLGCGSGQPTVVTLHYLFFSIPLYPDAEEEQPEQRTKKAKKRTKKRDKDAVDHKPKRDGWAFFSQLVEDVQRLWSPVKRLLRRTSLARVSLCMTVVGEDAADTALRFGKINAVVFSAVGILDRIVTLRVKQVAIVPGFSAEREEYVFFGELRVIPLAALIAAMQLGFWTLIALAKLSSSKRKDRRGQPAEGKEVSHGNQTPH